MKILLLNQTFYPDVLATSQQVTDLACYLSEKGADVTVLAGQRGYEDRAKVYPSKETWRGITILRAGSTSFGKGSILKRIVDSLTFDLALFWKLLWVPQQDVVVSFTSPPLVGVLGTLFCLWKSGRSVQWLMDVNPDAAFSVGYVKKDSLAGKFLNWAFEFSLKHSQHLIVLDRWMKEKIAAHGADRKKISVIPPWSVLNSHQTPSTGLFRKQNQLEGKFVVLYSGNHSVVHPLDTLLGAAYELRHDKGVEFVFAGSGLRTLDVDAFVKEHGLENVKRLPWQPREVLRDSFTSVDLHIVVMGNGVNGLVHTSKIYAVLSSGKPYVFIGPEKSHVTDLLKECPYGYHVEHGQVRELVQKIQEARKLSPERLELTRTEHAKFLSEHFGFEKSLGIFETEILRTVPSLKPFSTKTANAS